jgi:hypothetical protein
VELGCQYANTLMVRVPSIRLAARNRCCVGAAATDGWRLSLCVHPQDLACARLAPGFRVSDAPDPRHLTKRHHRHDFTWGGVSVSGHRLDDHRVTNDCHNAPLVESTERCTDTTPDRREGLPASLFPGWPFAAEPEHLFVCLRRDFPVRPTLRPVGHPLVEVELDLHEAVERPRQNHRRLQRPGHRRRDDDVYPCVLHPRDKPFCFTNPLRAQREQVESVTPEAFRLSVVVDASVSDEQKGHRPRLRAASGVPALRQRGHDAAALPEKPPVFAQ